MKYFQNTSTLVHNSALFALLLALTFGAFDSFAQANHNVTRSNKTQPIAAPGGDCDDDCDGVTVRGTLHREDGRLTIVFDAEGPVPAKARLAATDYNSSRSNKRKERRVASEGSLEHTDDWIAARATQSDTTGTDPTPIYMSINDGGLAAPPPGTTFEITLERSGKASQRFQGRVDEKGSFRIEGVPAGSYRVLVQQRDGTRFRGHVTVLK